jgi:drug/metabolite transporter (DMT)-like permease
MLDSPKINVQGFLCALLAGTFLAGAAVVSRYAYEGGTDAITLVTIRTLIVVLCLGFSLWIAKIDCTLPKHLIKPTIVNGVLFVFMTLGYLGSIKFIPVGLATLIFFTFPVIIAVLVFFFGIEELSPKKIIAIVVAFSGLILMLGSSAEIMDWRGGALALIGAVATAFNAIQIRQHFTTQNPFVTALHISCLSLIALIVICLLVGSLQIPATAEGWGGTVGVGLFQSVGTPLYLYAISRIGALKAGMAVNIQPIVAVSAAWILFDEILKFQQAVGGAIVILSIVSIQLIDYKKKTLQRRDLLP